MTRYVYEIRLLQSSLFTLQAIHLTLLREREKSPKIDTSEQTCITKFSLIECYQLSKRAPNYFVIKMAF